MDGAAQGRLRDRLVARYSTPDALDAFVHARLGVRLDHITTADGMTAKGHHVVRWCDERGLLGALEAALGPDPQSPDRVWTPAVLYPLQPAPHFAGREALVADLRRWATDSTDGNRVVALVAAGGTGKTALAERVLDALRDYTAAGVLVWNFYEEPRTEAFLRAACAYFLGEAPNEAGGLLERLQRALTGSAPHLLILDGLEVVQATGATGQPRGELDDPLMGRLLRWLAAGLGTRAKALVTSRFPLPDVAGWEGRGFRPIGLTDLDAPAARAVFRRWGVRGTDAALDALAAGVHRHALTVDVLGSYLATFHAGDPTQTPSFDLGYLADTDPRTAKLHRVLTSYAEKLPARERDLLVRLSVFPRGIDVESLSYLSEAGGEVAGTLAGCGPVELQRLLERLRGLGLVFRYDAGGAARFSAHPFLRGFFGRLLGVSDPRQVHEVVRARLAVGLSARPGSYPSDPAVLDRYERLVEATRLAGDGAKALDLYRSAVGGADHLRSLPGGPARGLRILSGFSADGTPAAVGPSLANLGRQTLVRDWGLFAMHLGDLDTARSAFAAHQSLCLEHPDRRGLDSALENLAELELRAGRWPASRDAAEAALRYSEGIDYEAGQASACTRLGTASLGLGSVADARGYFGRVRHFERTRSLDPLEVWREAEFRLAVGDWAESRDLTVAVREYCRLNDMAEDLARLDTVLARAALSDDPAEARAHSAVAREFAARTGHVELTLSCYHLAAEVARHDQDFVTAVTEAEAGIQLADSCGFGRWSLDIRTELVTTHLAAGEPAKAIEPAGWVLMRSQEEDCQYAWGTADSLHLLGVAHARLGDTAKARDYLSRAAEKRKPLEHPGLAETEAELRKLGG